ncbi:MAG: diadenylate cyclase CdaA [Thermoanaerobaculum sp.]|nr:diadenylate cyclase CdaA [Thermoanaerobaculum sp.]
MSGPWQLLRLPVDVAPRDLADIFLVALLFYFLLRALQGRRALVMLWGILILVGGFLAAQAADLITLAAILDKVLFYLPLAVIVLFQQDIRRILAAVGQAPLLRFFATAPTRQVLVNDLVLACRTLRSRRYGALIVIERAEGLRSFAETGIPLDALCTYDLLVNLFTPGTPLHDGAVIIQGGRIQAAGCFLPLTLQANISSELGSRHRAALGISEETDAVALVVSEERGEVSVAVGGTLHRDLEEQALRDLLVQLLYFGQREGQR